MPEPAWRLVCPVSFSRCSARPAPRGNSFGILGVEARIDNLLDETCLDHLAGINRAMGSDIPVGEPLYGTGRTISAGLVFIF